jgi:hypothetical protein
MSGQLQTLNTPPPVSVQTLLYGIYQATSSGSGGSTAWGSITGTLSNQTDLQTALNLKTNNAAAAITGGSVTGLTSFGLANADASGYGLFFQVNEVLSSPRVLSLKTNNANRTLDLSGNLTLGGNFTTTGSGTIALGGFTLTVPATGTAALLGTPNAYTAANTLTLTGLGTTPIAGFSLINSTAAAAGAQQASPSLVWEGQGWKTDATAASQAVCVRANVLPIQGTSGPRVDWRLQRSVNAGAFADFLRLVDNGASPPHLDFYGTGGTVYSRIGSDSSNNLLLQSWSGNVGLGGSGGVGVGLVLASALKLSSNYSLDWVSSSNAALSGTTDLSLTREAANTHAWRNGTNAQTGRIYGTYTDASNYRRLAIGSTTAGVFSITAEGAGTGASGNVLHISSLPTSNPGPGILWNNAGTPAIGT